MKLVLLISAHCENPQFLGLQRIVDFSWQTVQQEKDNMIHLLDFPYNGETRREDLTTKITENKHHLYASVPQ